MVDLLACKPQIWLNAITEWQKYSLIGSMKNGFASEIFVAVIDKCSFLIKSLILKAKESKLIAFNLKFLHYDW